MKHLFFFLLFLAAIRPAGAQQPAVPDTLPRDMVWFNREYPFTLESLHDKIVVAVLWHPDCAEALGEVQKIQELAFTYPQIQVLSVFPGDERRPFSSGYLQQFIQLAGLNHPVGILNDRKGWRSLQEARIPSAVLYLNSTTAERVEQGVDGLIRLQARLSELVKDSRLMSSLVAWQARPVVDPKVWANPVVELPAFLSSPAAGSYVISEPAHQRLLLMGGDGTPEAIVGNGQPGYTDGAAFGCRMRNPAGTALDAGGGLIYFSDPGNHRVRVADYQNQLIYTLAGNGRMSDAPSDSCRGVLGALGLPMDLELQGNTLYVLSGGSNQLFETDVRTGMGPAVVDFPRDRYRNGVRAYPVRMAPSGAGLLVVMTDGSVWECRRPAKGQKKWESREIYRPADPLMEAASVCEEGGKMYLALPWKNAIAELTNGRAVVVLGGEPGCADGEGEAVRFHHPVDLVPFNGRIAVLDQMNHQVRMVQVKKSLQAKTPGFRLTPELMLTPDALDSGELLFLEPSIFSEGKNEATITLDLQGWTLDPDGRNEVFAEVYPGVGLESNEITSEVIPVTLDAISGENYFQLEFYLTLRSPDCPQLVIQKKAVVGIPGEVIPGEEASVELNYRPNLLP